ncbi:hypothetical protein BAQ_B0136, partial (plasmid) [Bacillus anthracis str. A0193]
MISAQTGVFRKKKWHYVL